MLALKCSVDGIRGDRSSAVVAELYCGMEVRCMTELLFVVVDEGLESVVVAFADESHDRMFEVFVQ